MNDSTIDYRQPFELLPNRVWRTYSGGMLLDRIEGTAQPADGHFPEDWVGSATRAVNPRRETLVDEGVGSARTVDGRVRSMERIFGADPVAAMGATHVEAFGPQPQLLVKLLDSAMRLHVQAHPSVTWAMQHLDSTSGKTEAWWILESREPDPWVYLGFQRPPTPEAWRDIVDRQDIDAMTACFDRVPVSPGDVLLIEGGVPHAIGPGLLMVEIQEPTDYVVRCEYAHGGVQLPESARTMGLGLDRVLDLFDYTPYPVDTVAERFGPRPRTIGRTDSGCEQVLLEAPQTDRVEARRIRTTGAMDLALDGRFSILVVLAGTGSITADGTALPLEPWTRVFLPAAVGSATLDGRMDVARCMPPKPADGKGPQ